jgi:hypothetical protein
MNTNEGVIPLKISPDIITMNKINQWNKSDNSLKSFALTRLVSVVAGAPIAVLGILFNSFAFVIKLPVTSVRILTGWIPTKGGKFCDKFAVDTSLKHLVWHAYKITFCVVDIVLFPILGLIHPGANIWIHIKLKGCFVEEISNTVNSSDIPAPPPLPNLGTNVPGKSKINKTGKRKAGVDLSKELEVALKNKDFTGAVIALEDELANKDPKENELVAALVDAVKARVNETDDSDEGEISEEDEYWAVDDNTSSSYYTPSTYSALKAPSAPFQEENDFNSDTEETTEKISQHPDPIVIPGMESSVADRRSIFGEKANSIQQQIVAGKYS